MLWEDNYLAHFGIKGQKWGIRRFQNPDGTLTEAGKKHYGVAAKEFKEKATADAEKMKNSGNGTEKGAEKGTSKSALKEASITGQMTGAKKPSLLNQIKANWQANYLPPEMRGKSKEEIKAWEKKENEKFDAESKKEDTERKFYKQLDKFDKLSPEDKQKVGDEVLKRISEYDKNWANATHDERKTGDGLREWLFEQIKDKSANWNVDEAHSPKARKIMDQMNEVSRDYWDRREEIEKQIKYDEVPYTKAEQSSITLQMINSARREKEMKRLQEALKKDSTIQVLDQEHKKLENNLCEQVLKDLGFSVTAANISMIFPYVMND